MVELNIFPAAVSISLSGPEPIRYFGCEHSGSPLGKMMNMKMKLRSVTRRVGLLGALGLSCIAALDLAAKEPPKLSVSDQAVDRSTRGASYANVIKRVTPSVVTIQSTRTIQMRQYRHPFQDDPMFRRFFGEGDGAGPGSRRMREESLGSGVIVTEDGYILTNNHVVDGADEDGIVVSLADGKTKYDAKVVGKDARTDLAVLKVDAPKKLPAITLGGQRQA